MCTFPPGFLWQERLSNLGQRWQQWLPRQGGCKPGSHLARQPGSQAAIRCSGAPAAPRRSPLYRRDIKPWIIYASPPIPSSFSYPLHVALNGRPANCSLPSTSWLNDYCIFFKTWVSVITALLILSVLALRWTNMFCFVPPSLHNSIFLSLGLTGRKHSRNKKIHVV